MSLNNIHLNASMIAGLYKNSLVESGGNPKGIGKGLSVLPEEDIEVKNNESVTDWKYLGDYKKNILILVRYPSIPFLPDDQLNFLSTILGACKLNLGDVAILNISNHEPIIYSDVLKKFRSSFLILFGVTPKEFDLPVNFPEYQVQSLNNCTFLYAPVLEKLESDKVLKSKLWVCLKKMFAV